MYVKLTGAAIVVLCSAILGTDIAAEKKNKAHRYKCLSDFFGLVNERLISGNTAIAKILTECSDDCDGIIQSLIADFAQQINEADSKCMKEAFDKCAENYEGFENSPEFDYISEFANQWDISGIGGSIKSSEMLMKRAYEVYTEMTQNLSNETKLSVLGTTFAGVITVLMLI